MGGEPRGRSNIRLRADGSCPPYCVLLMRGTCMFASVLDSFSSGLLNPMIVDDSQWNYT